MQFEPIAFSMVANDQALEVITEEPKGLLESAYPDCIHASSSTVSPAASHKLMLQHQEKGAQFIAAPVLGRPDAAARQELWICMAGQGSQKKALPLLNTMGKKVYDFGEEPEAANAVKLAGNFMILSVIEMLSEAFAFIQKKDVVPEHLHTFLTETLFPSPVFLNYGKPILQQKFSPAGFKLALGLKDINLFLDAAKSLDLSSPFAQELHNRLLISVDKGRTEMDWSAISLLAEEGS